MRSIPRRPPPAGLVHQVSQGENIESIAFLYGHFARSLWNDENNAALREKRPNPNVLHPGDEVFIPGLRERQESRPVDCKHRFRRKGVPSLVRVRALVRGRPLAEQPYTVEADGVRTSGVTDGGGLVECYVRPNARVALVRIGAEPLCWELRVSLRTLDPVTEITGLQARLINLGILCATIDGVLGDSTRAALRSFQAGQGLEPTGEPDEPTRARLVKIHGS